MKKINTILLIAGTVFGSTIKAQSDYNDVAEIFYSHCTYCHHNGGIAPFSLMNFIETSSFSNSIYNSVNAGSMPPWQADTAYTTSGRKVPHYLGENILTFVEKTAILDWINDGALEGDPELVPEAPKYGDVSLRLNGNADLTLQIPTFASNASPTLTNPYNCFVIPANLTEDRWLRAFEIVPGNLAAVHHVVVSIDTTNTRLTDTSGQCASQGGQFGIGGWTPGTPPTVFPSKEPFKAGIRIPAGSNFILQMHYAPGSDGLLDSTKLRMFFYPKEEENGVREMYSNTLIQRWSLAGFGFGVPDFPSHTITTHKATSETSAFVPHAKQPTGDFTIFAANPHAHAVCTKIKNYAFKGTDTIPIINIPNWDFNWEGNYYFPKPLLIPAGYTIESEHVYDNTIANTHLEGTTRVDVSYGQGTEDEMLFDSFLYMDYLPGDEDIDLKSIIESDTLLKVGIKEEFNKSALHSFIYPNPANHEINLQVAGNSLCIAKILNITGQTVLNSTSFIGKTTIDLSEIIEGLYIIEITDLKTGDRETKKIIVSH